MRFLVAVALVVGLSSAAFPCGRCGFQVCRYQYPAKLHTAQPYNYTDQRFQVTYNLSLPPPAASGSTIYQYQQQQYGYGLDPAQFMNASSRYLELSQDTARRGFEQFQQTAQLSLQGQAALAELQASRELYETLLKFKPLSGLASGQSLTIRASRGADGRIQLEHPEGTVAGGGDEAVKLVSTACATCHQPGGRQPTPDLSDLSKLDLARWGADIVHRLTTSDPKEMMPPPDGPRLTDEQKRDLAARFLVEMRAAAKETATGPARGPVAPKE